MSSIPVEDDNQRMTVGDDGVPERPIRSGVATWVPRTATVGFVGLSLWRAQKLWIPGSASGVMALIAPLFGTDPFDRSLAIGTVQALASPLLVWTLEGYRTSNQTRVLSWPWIFGAATQRFGIDLVAPCYYACSVIADGRYFPLGTIDPDAALAALPATLLGHVLPGLLMSTMHLTFTEVSRSTFNPKSILCLAFCVSPMIVSSLTLGVFAGIKWLRRNEYLPSAALLEVAKATDEEPSTKPSVSALKTAYATMFTVQASQYMFQKIRLVSSIQQALAPFSHGDRLMLVHDWARNAEWRPVLTSPLAYFEYSTLAFGLYTVWDLRRRGYITTREATWAVLAFGLGFGTVGIGADYAGLWYWRECVLDRVRDCSTSQPVEP